MAESNTRRQFRSREPCAPNRAFGARARNPRSRAAVPAASISLQQRLGNHDAGHFVVQAQRLLVTGQRPQSDHAPGSAIFRRCVSGTLPVLRDRKSAGSWRSARPLRPLRGSAASPRPDSSATRIDGDADGEIRRAAEIFPGPVGSLIEARDDLHQADGIDFVDAAAFPDDRRATADRR